MTASALRRWPRGSRVRGSATHPRDYVAPCGICGGYLVRDIGMGPPRKHNCRRRWKLLRAMMFMMRCDGVSYAEIASILGVTRSTVALAERVILEECASAADALTERLAKSVSK